MTLFIGGSDASPSGRREEGERENGLQLNEVLTSEALRPIVREGDISSDLVPHLPPTNEDTETALTSPQFQQVPIYFLMHMCICTCTCTCSYIAHRKF